MIGTSTSLKRLHLHLPEYDCDYWIRALVSEISENSQIEEISLQGSKQDSKLGADGLVALGVLLKGSQLKSLFLDFHLSGSPDAYSSFLQGLARQSNMKFWDYQN